MAVQDVTGLGVGATAAALTAAVWHRAANPRSAIRVTTFTAARGRVAVLIGQRACAATGATILRIGAAFPSGAVRRTPFTLAAGTVARLGCLAGTTAFTTAVWNRAANSHTAVRCTTLALATGDVTRQGAIAATTAFTAAIGDRPANPRSAIRATAFTAARGRVAVLIGQRACAATGATILRIGAAFPPGAVRLARLTLAAGDVAGLGGHAVAAALAATVGHRAANSRSAIRETTTRNLDDSLSARTDHGHEEAEGDATSQANDLSAH